MKASKKISMGLLWDLLQQSQLSQQQNQLAQQAGRSADLSGRIGLLEVQVQNTQKLLHAVIERLEQQLKTDLDADGKGG
jgi:hypothetical protein